MRLSKMAAVMTLPFYWVASSAKSEEIVIAETPNAEFLFFLAEVSIKGEESIDLLDMLQVDENNLLAKEDKVQLFPSNADDTVKNKLESDKDMKHHLTNSTKENK